MYRLADGGWIATQLVTSAPADVPVAQVIPPPPATATAKPRPTKVPPTAGPAVAAPGRVQLTYVNYDGAVYRVESDEYLVVKNVGGSPVAMSGWMINAGDDGQNFWFPGGFVLGPGQECRVYTDEVHQETCGLSFGSGRAVWNNDGDCGYLYDPNGNLVSQRCY